MTSAARRTSRLVGSARWLSRGLVLGGAHGAAADELPTGAATGPTPTLFRNPVLAPAQDPMVLLHEGRYFYCESSPEGVFLRAADSFVDLAAAPPQLIWRPEPSGPASRNLWAPELHHLDGRWFIYFAADDGNNANHRMWVLEATTADPTGPYLLHPPLETGGWAIDGTVLTDSAGQRFFVWSGWPGAVDGQQNLYVARMSSPVRIDGERVLLAQPDQPWERHALPLLEGPQILQRDGRTLIVYSASGSWTADYCLGALVTDGEDFLNPRTWRKLAQPIFTRNQHAFGPGHCSFTTTPDGREHWILYHAKTTDAPGWGDREVRAQPFFWTIEGLPFLGEPAPRELALARPGERGASLAPGLVHASPVDYVPLAPPAPAPAARPGSPARCRP